MITRFAPVRGGALLGLAIALALPGAAVAQIVIDEFSTNQATLSDPPGGASSIATGGADILGQRRDLQVKRLAGAGPVTTGVAASTASFAVAGTMPDSAGLALVTWDGDSDPLVLDPTGLGGVDLTGGGAAGFQLTIASASAGVGLQLEVWTDAGNASQAMRTLPAIAAPTIVFVAYSEFLPTLGTGADFTGVGAIRLTIYGGNDSALELDRIATGTPSVAALKADFDTSGVPLATISPGGTIRYRVTITNTGSEARTLALTDVLDPNTALASAVRSTPIARVDQYRAFADLPFDSAVEGAPALVANDGDPDGNAVAAVPAVGQATSQGGSVTIQADGSFVYTPAPGFVGVDSFTYQIAAVAGDPTTDANGTPISPPVGRAYLLVVPVPPTVTAGGTLAYTENDPATAIDTTLTVTDPDSNVVGATAQITGNYANGEDVLSCGAPCSGLSPTFVAGTGTLTLTGSATPAAYQTALRGVRYANGSENPSTASRTVTWIADDGFGTSAPATSTITVASVNDPPVVTTSGGVTSFTEDGGPVTVDSALTVTDPDDVNLASASVTIVNPQDGSAEVLAASACAGLTVTPGLNSLSITGAQPPATYQTCLRSVTYDNASQNPNATQRTVRFVANDGAANSGPGDKGVSVTPVNDPPVAGADAWDTAGNTRLVVDLPAPAAPHVRDTTPSTFGVLDNDSDPAEGNAVAVSGIVGCADATPPFGDSPACATSNGGSVVMEANGRFTYTPPAGTVSDDTFQYVATDDGAPPASSNGTVTIHFFERIWYVENDSAAGGLGRSHDPFDTLAEAQTASVAGDWIFVHFGDGTSTGQSNGIVLKSAQHLLGEHAGLQVPANFNGNGTNQVLFAAVPGNRPRIDNSGAGNNAVSATDAIPTEIVGLSLQSAGGNAVDLTLTGAFSSSGNLTILNNEIRGAGAEGIDVNSGGTGTLTLAVSGNLWNVAGTHTGNAIDVARTGGTLRLNFGSNTNILSAATAVNIAGGAAASTIITGFANNTVHQNTVGSGILVGNATFDATPGGAYNTVSGGATAVGIVGDGVGGAAMALSNVVGDLSFTDLDLFGASGLTLSGSGAVSVGAGTGTRLTVGAGVATFNATGGPAVDVSNATVDLQLAGLSSSGSATTGVSLVNVADGTTSAAFSAPPGSSISGATGTAFNVDGGNATISYAGTISNSAGKSVVVQNRSGDSATFTGSITDTGTGISLTSNTGSTIAFSGTLVLNTGANTAFNATGGGTVTATDTASTLTSTTATALNVASTSIGAAGLTFRSISANGATKGIVLNSTGTAAGNGGLSVTGTGATSGSGGTIQNVSARGGEFITTKALSLKNMNFTNANTTDGGTCTDLSTAGCNAAIYLSGVSTATLDNINVSGTTAQQAINGLSVSNFTLNNSTLTNCGTSGSTEEGCIKMRELTGTCSITGSNLSFPGQDVVEIVNTAGPALTLNVTGSTFRDSQSSTAGGNGLQARSEGSASMVLNVTGSSFLRLKTNGLQATAINTASNDVDVTTSTFDPGTGTMIGLDLDADNTATLVFNVQNNPMIYSRNGPAVNVFGDTSATINGRINSNPDVQVKSNVGSNVGSGIRVNINKDATARIEVKNNVVNIGSDDAGIDLSGIGKTVANPGGATNTLDATVTGNTVTIGATSTYGIIILSATTAANTNAICANVGSNAITRNPASIASFRARVPSAAGFFRMEGFVTDAEATWNAKGNTPMSVGGSEVSFGGAGTFGACTAALPTNPGPN